ncbi:MULTISPECIES: hypothetical protein [Sphingobacterium]|jgi:hypothetical protein|uniref:hypothetical protein n=1 Tax=Sphingobacterium TaxID=28453 RepID=UPI0009662844|nr:MULTISPECIES: hypothetical protein [Sphingobacterium]OJY99714.1 MAG: hypothetical protein BGP15_20720 [Sphingobacterium sp. 40-24]HAF37124.1 hypothetical protein [Sphingobacterium sp.]
MEETIDTLAQSNIPAQSFRITFKGQDFQIRILEKELHRGISEISILLDGMVQKLKKNQDRWHFEGSENDIEFANDIGRSISLRYRL